METMVLGVVGALLVTAMLSSIALAFRGKRAGLFVGAVWWLGAIVLTAMVTGGFYGLTASGVAFGAAAEVMQDMIMLAGLAVFGVLLVFVAHAAGGVNRRVRQKGEGQKPPVE